MKRKSLKLFLSLCVALLSLFAFASCNDTPPENEPEASTEKYNRKEIKDSEYIDFVFSEYMNRYSFLTSEAPSPYSKLVSLYSTHSKNADCVIKEYVSAGKTKLIAGYIPKEYIELIFKTDTDAYLNSLNGSSMYTIAEYLTLNDLTYRDIGFKLYYVDENKVKPSYNDEFIVYMGEESFITDNDGNSIKFIGSNIFFRLDKNHRLKFTNFEGPAFPLAIRFFGVTRNESFLKSFGKYCKIIAASNGTDVVIEYEYDIKATENAEEFLEAFSAAELYVETKLDENGGEYIYKRIYDYEKVKEILNIQ